MSDVRESELQIIRKGVELSEVIRESDGTHFPRDVMMAMVAAFDVMGRLFERAAKSRDEYRDRAARAHFACCVADSVMDDAQRDEINRKMVELGESGPDEVEAFLQEQAARATDYLDRMGGMDDGQAGR